MTTDHFEARIAELHAADERNKLIETCAIALADHDGSVAFKQWNDTTTAQKDRDDYRDKARTVLEAADYDQLSEDRGFHAKRCLDVETVLDRALGTDGEDGTGEGIAADVALVVAQRDEMREKFAALAALEEYNGESCDNASHNIRAVLSGEYDPRPDAKRYGLEATR